MSRTDYEEVEVRKELRKRYFEDPEYHQLSKILRGGMSDDTYGSRRDDLMILSCILGCEITGRHRCKIDELLEHKDDKRVNWDAIYQYVDERLNDPVAKWKKELTNYQRALPITVEAFLNDYRNILLPEFDII